LLVLNNIAEKKQIHCLSLIYGVARYLGHICHKLAFALPLIQGVAQLRVNAVID